MCSCRVWSPGEPVMWQPERSWKTEGEKNASNLSHFSSFSFQSGSLNPTHYCVTRAMKQLFSHKSVAVLRKHPSPFFYCCFIFNHVVWLKAMDSFQTTNNICKPVRWTEVYKSLEESQFRTWFQFLWKWKQAHFLFIFHAYL